MKIGLITTSYPHQENPSSGIFVKRLVDALRKSISVTVLTPESTSDNFLPDLDLHRFKYAPSSYQILAHQPGGIPLALKKSKLHYLLLPTFFLSLFLSSMFLARKVDLLHANWSVTGLIAGVAGLLTRTPVITTLRGDDVKMANNSYMFRAVLCGCIKLNSCIVTVNCDTVKLLISDYGMSKNNIFHISNGVNKSFFDIYSNEKIYDVDIVTVGSLIKRKGVDIIIRSLSQLERYKWSLTIVGDGPDRYKLENMIKDFSLEKRVTITGSVHPDDVPYFLKNANVFVLSSYSEGRPNVVLEAMASGLAVISSKVDGIDELITDHENGFLYDVGDYKGLRLLLKKIMDNHQLIEDLGKKSYCYACSEIGSWEDTANKYIDLYKTILSQSGINS